jgi:hypothetical protein
MLHFNIVGHRTTTQVVVISPRSMIQLNDQGSRSATMFSKESTSGRSSKRKQPSFIQPLLGMAIFCLILLALFWPKTKEPNPIVAVQISTLTARPTFTPTPIPPTTPSRPPSTPLPPTPTNTRVVPLKVYQTATRRGTKRAAGQADNQADYQADNQVDNQVDYQLAMARLQTPHPTQFITTPTPSPLPAPATSPGRGARLVLAHYFAWYDDHSWNNCNISAGDKPLEPYHSDDPAAIARHIQLALEAGLNGFTLHWFAPDDRTDRNFDTLLAQSKGHNFFSTIVFSHHIWTGVPIHSQQTIGEALRYVIDHHSNHPNFLRLDGKPVLLFTDVYRTPPSGETPQQFWATVRNQVDPQRQTWWIAEGLDPSYLSVFDGLYVFKISHANSLHDYVKSPRWGAQVRAWEKRTGQPKLWLATISPGWDDLRASCQPDVRVPNTPHRLDRADGAVYQATFEAALASNPDWLIVSSFNEWVEGSYIEPSEFYGDKYLQMTKGFVKQFK